MCEIPRNSREILSNTCRYNIFETYLGYWGCLIDENLQIYLETSSPQCANNVSKLPGVNYVAKNWALVMMLKALPLAHFSSALLLEYFRLSLLKTLHTLVKSAQNQSISTEICPENSHEIGCFSVKLAAKISAKFVSQLKIPWNFTSATYQKPCSIMRPIRFDRLKISPTEVGINLPWPAIRLS